MKKVIAMIGALLLCFGGYVAYQYHLKKEASKELDNINSKLGKVKKTLKNSGAMWKRNHLYSANIIDNFKRRSTLSLICNDGSFKLIIGLGKSVVVNNEFTLNTTYSEFDNSWLINAANNGLILQEPESLELAKRLASSDGFRVNFKAGFNEVSPNFIIDKDNNPILEEVGKCKS